MTIYKKISDVWTPIIDVFVKVSGVWRSCDVAHDKVSGTWRIIHQAPRAIFKIQYNVNSLEYVRMTSGANTSDFGDLWRTNSGVDGLSSSTRAVFAGGRYDQWDTVYHDNTLQYVTIQTAGNTTDFGNLIEARHVSASVSSETRGVISGGWYYNDSIGMTDYELDSIEYITIASTGNASSFGSLTPYDIVEHEGCGSTTRGIFAGGRHRTHADPYSGGEYGTNLIHYITIASAGNASSFGELTVDRTNFGAVSSNIRGVFGGYMNHTNSIDYITIASTGNASDFGDLTSERSYLTGASSKIKGLFAGGYIYSLGYCVNNIDQVTIATTGNATDFGDVSQSTYGYETGVSSAHGGL